MGHSQASKAESRERILTEAARRLREDGPDGLGIAALMQAAGLTHGGFYAHFPSRAALLEAALARALEDGQRASLAARAAQGDAGLDGLARSYLSRAHRDEPTTGCAIAALAGEISRADPSAQQVMREAIESIVARTEALIGAGPDSRERALAAWSTLVGGLVLARATAGSPLSDEVLAAARAGVAHL
ncbi:MAG: TetR/AcrR family transcriptional regulator [Novosphingobium sp.]